MADGLQLESRHADKLMGAMYVLNFDCLALISLCSNAFSVEMLSVYTMQIISFLDDPRRSISPYFPFSISPVFGSPRSHGPWMILWI